MPEQLSNPDQQTAGAEFSAEAAQAAERAASAGNSEYLEHHPQAIQDSEVAQIMAITTASDEESVVRFTNEALELAMNPPTSFRGREHPSDLILKADSARESADLKARVVHDTHTNAVRIKGGRRLPPVTF